jgi:hypothetical protein
MNRMPLEEFALARWQHLLVPGSALPLLALLRECELKGNPGDGWRPRP